MFVDTLDPEDIDIDIDIDIDTDTGITIVGVSSRLFGPIPPEQRGDAFDVMPVIGVVNFCPEEDNFCNNCGVDDHPTSWCTFGKSCMDATPNPDEEPDYWWCGLDPYDSHHLGSCPWCDTYGHGSPDSIIDCPAVWAPARQDNTSHEEGLAEYYRCVGPYNPFGEVTPTVAELAAAVTWGAGVVAEQTRHDEEAARHAKRTQRDTSERYKRRDGSTKERPRTDKFTGDNKRRAERQETRKQLSALCANPGAADDAPPLTTPRRGFVNMWWVLSRR